MLDGGGLRHKLVDQGLPRHRLPLGQPHKVEPFRVKHEQVAEVLAGVEDLQQRRQGVPIALEQRAERQWIAGRLDESLQVVQRHVGIGAAGQVAFKLTAYNRQQIHRHAGRGHAEQVAVCPPHVDDAQPAEPRGGGLRIVKILADGCGIHSEANRAMYDLRLEKTAADYAEVRQGNRARAPKLGSLPNLRSSA